MSTLADATLIQSATESHQAEWLQEGQHLRAVVTVFGVCVCVRGGCLSCFFYLNLKDHFANPDLGTLSQKCKQIDTFPGDQRKMPFLLRLETIPLVTSEFIATLTIFLVVKLLIYLCLPGFYVFFTHYHSVTTQRLCLFQPRASNLLFGTTKCLMSTVLMLCRWRSCGG